MAGDVLAETRTGCNGRRTVVTQLRPLAFISSPKVALRAGIALRDMNLAGNDCAEAGRWIVLPSARGTDLAKILLLSCWAVGLWLNKRCVFGLAGTRDGQAKMICRTGGQTVPGMDARLVQDLDDDVSLVYFDLDRPPKFVAAQLPSVRRLLQLSDL